MSATVDTAAATSRNGSQTPHVSEKSAETETVEFRDLEQVFKALQPGAVFSEPIVSGQYTVITASALSAAGGFAMGKGVVPVSRPPSNKAEDPEPTTAAKRPFVLTTSWGGGGGGGASGRPVAIIVIGPEGVKVEPVFDLTRIIMASITMWRWVFPVLFKRRRRM